MEPDVSFARRCRSAASVLNSWVSHCRKIAGRFGVLAGLRALVSNPKSLANAMTDALVNAESFSFFAMDQSADLSKSQAAAKDHVFIYADADQLQTYAAQMPPYVGENTSYLDSGDLCLLQIEGNDAVGCTWSTYERVAYALHGVHLSLKKDAFYSYMGYTDARWRGYGFQPLRKQMLLEKHAESGSNWMLGYVPQNALPALRGTRRSADLRVGRFRVQRGKGRVRVQVTCDQDFWTDPTHQPG